MKFNTTSSEMRLKYHRDFMKHEVRFIFADTSALDDMTYLERVIKEIMENLGLTEDDIDGCDFVTTVNVE